MLEDETDSESESEYDSDTEYYPSESESETEYEVEYEVESEDEAEAESDGESVSSEDGESMKERIDYLRSELALAESMMKKWQAEQDAANRDNWWCIRVIMTIIITAGIYGFIESTLPPRKLNW
jgi:hypothetical protein